MFALYGHTWYCVWILYGLTRCSHVVAEHAAFRPLFALGSGQFGVMWLLAHNDGRRLVDKRVSLSGLTDEQKRDTKKEIELLRRLEHRYVVRYHDSYEDEVVDKKGVGTQTLHILMEYCDEGPLDAKIAEVKSATSLSSSTMLARLACRRRFCAMWARSTMPAGQ